MKAWINGICDEVDRFTAQQTEYQKLLTQWRALEPRYLEILASLPEEDAELLRDYEYLFSEMEYLKRQNAYQFGCQQK